MACVLGRSRTLRSSTHGSSAPRPNRGAHGTTSMVPRATAPRAGRADSERWLRDQQPRRPSRFRAPVSRPTRRGGRPDSERRSRARRLPGEEPTWITPMISQAASTQTRNRLGSPSRSCNRQRPAREPTWNASAPDDSGRTAVHRKGQRRSTNRMPQQGHGLHSRPRRPRRSAASAAPSLPPWPLRFAARPHVPLDVSVQSQTNCGCEARDRTTQRPGGGGAKRPSGNGWGSRTRRTSRSPKTSMPRASSPSTSS